MKISNQSIKVNYILSVILNFASYIFPLITFPYVTRVLGADALGKVSFAETAASYFVLLASLGIPTYGIRACAAVRDDRNKLSKVTKELLIISGIMTTFSLVLFLVLIFFLPQFFSRKSLLLINSISVILSPFGVNWFFNAIEDFRYITIRSLFTKFVTLIFTFLFVKNIEDYKIYAFILVLSSSGVNIFNFILLNKYIDLRVNCKIDLKQHIKPIFILFATTAAATIYSSVDVTMLGFICGDEPVGFYNVAHKLRQVILAVITTLGTVLIPRLSYYIKNNKEEAFKSLVIKGIWFTSFLAIPMCLFFLVSCKESIMILAGEQFTQSIYIFICLLPTLMFCSFSNITGLQIIVPLEKENVLLKSLLIGATIDIIFNLLFVKSLAAIGVAIATTIAELSVLIYQLYYLTKNNLLQLDNLNIRNIVLASIISLFIVIVLNKFTFGFNVIISFIMKGIIFWGIYLMLLFFVKDTLFLEFLSPFLNIIRGGK